MPDELSSSQIPDYQACMLPLLELMRDGQNYQVRSLTKAIADSFRLSDAARIELLPSGQQTVIANRVAWAKTYLKKAGLISNPARGIVAITDEGKRVLQLRPTSIDTNFLKQYPSFSDFYSATNSIDRDVEYQTDTATPEETLESAYSILHSALVDELIDRLKTCSPSFFEQLVVDMLVGMGYGGSQADAGQALGRTGDGGIDGIIKEDKLGLDVICIQAKRWENNVGRPEVQAFAGSMEGMRAKKGVLITTAGFTREATEYIQRIERKIVLIDGKKLADLMIEHNIGVSTSRTYSIKKIDIDYFEGEEVL